MAVNALEIILLTARPRNGEAEFEPYTETAEGQDATNDPEEQGDAD